MNLPQLFLYLIIFLYGIIIGSFLNVCIYRIPNGENIATSRSHCMKCGHKLKWYELIPIMSYIMQSGRCRQCKTTISIQYPLIEGLNGIMYVNIFMVNGINMESVFLCLLGSALIVLSVIDFRTYEIPEGINIFILVLSIIKLIVLRTSILEAVVGGMCVSGFLLIIFYATKGRGIGGGDIKLMGAAGIFLGFKLIILSFFLGCILGSIIHLIRMRVQKEGHMLAMGPYLAMGIYISMLYGNQLINWYISWI